MRVGMRMDTSTPLPSSTSPPHPPKQTKPNQTKKSRFRRLERQLFASFLRRSLPLLLLLLLLLCWFLFFFFFSLTMSMSRFTIFFSFSSCCLHPVHPRPRIPASCILHFLLLFAYEVSFFFFLRSTYDTTLSYGHDWSLWFEWTICFSFSLHPHCEPSVPCLLR